MPCYNEDLTYKQAKEDLNDAINRNCSKRPLNPRYFVSVKGKGYFGCWLRKNNEY